MKNHADLGTILPYADLLKLADYLAPAASSSASSASSIFCKKKNHPHKFSEYLLKGCTITVQNNQLTSFTW